MPDYRITPERDRPRTGSGDLPLFLLGMSVLTLAFVLVLDDTPPRRLRMLDCPAATKPMARLELLFGLSRKSDPPIGDDDWRAFLASEVTPRFPEGLTVLDGDGQWRGKSGEIGKEATKVLLIWHAPAADTETRIAAIRQAWKARFAQESVMRADSRACVSF